MENLQTIYFKNWGASFIPAILKEIWIDQIYAPFFHGKENLTIIDAGSNIGLFSMYASLFAKQIYAFEPTKETYDIGVLNLKEYPNIKTFQVGIGTEDTKNKIYHYTNTTMNSTFGQIADGPLASPNLAVTGFEECEFKRFDTIVKEEKIEHIDFLKLDIEGDEGKVIGSKSFQNITPILDSLVVELHAWSNVNPQQIVTTLRDYGYNVNVIPSDAILLGATKK